MSKTKAVIVTGAGQGLGLELVRQFVARGWKVAGTGRAEKPTDFPEDATYHAFDASDAAACVQFVQQIAADQPEADWALVNNAGGYIAGKLQEMTIEQIEKQIHANYLPAVYMTHAFVGAKDQGRIINVISSVAHTPQASNSIYGSTKAAQKYFFQSLQKEYRTSQFRISNIYPNAIATRGVDENAIHPEELAKYICDMTEQANSFYVRDVTLYSSRP